MANRSVRPRPEGDGFIELRERLESDEIEAMEPFGRAMTAALERDSSIRRLAGLWIEGDNCSPPLAMERAEVLDDYFEDITIVEEVEPKTVGSGGFSLKSDQVFDGENGRRETRDML